MCETEKTSIKKMKLTAKGPDKKIDELHFRITKKDILVKQNNKTTRKIRI